MSTTDPRPLDTHRTPADPDPTEEEAREAVVALLREHGPMDIIDMTHRLRIPVPRLIQATGSLGERGVIATVSFSDDDGDSWRHVWQLNPSYGATDDGDAPDPAEPCPDLRAELDAMRTERDALTARLAEVDVQRERLSRALRALVVADPDDTATHREAVRVLLEVSDG